MVAFNKFQDAAERIAAGVHNFDTDTLRVYLSNATPSASGDTVKGDLAEISTGNGYSGPVDIQNAMTETGGTATVTATDVQITASGGSVGPFRYVVLFNDTQSDRLLGWWDNGSEITLDDGDSFTIDFGASVLTVS